MQLRKQNILKDGKAIPRVHSSPFSTNFFLLRAFFTMSHLHTLFHPKKTIILKEMTKSHFLI